MRPRLVVFGLSALAGALIMFAAPHTAGADTCQSAFDEYAQRGWLWMYLASFGFGFLTSLTPCVYPMVPITLAIFGAKGADVTRKRALALATVYVVGMGLTYAALGVTVAMLGKTGDFGSQLASPWVVIPIVLLFAILAVSMFGAFNLQLPTSIQTKLNQIGGKGFGGAFAMGLVGGLIAAPCTGPFLLGLLTFVATSHNVLGGGSLLFVYALGMGVLFWVLAAAAMSLPKSGAWMEHVKSIGGMLLLFAGVYFLLPLVPKLKHVVPSDTWFVIPAIAAIAIGLALGAVQRSFHGSGKDIALKGVGVALCVVGASALWIWHLAPTQELAWEHDEKVAFDRARAEGKGVLVDFSASWCLPCQEYEHMFGDDEVMTPLTDQFVLLKMDVTSNSDADEDKKKRYDAGDLPSVQFRSADNRVLTRLDGHAVPKDTLISNIQRATVALRTGTLTAKCD